MRGNKGGPRYTSTPKPGTGGVRRRTLEPFWKQPFFRHLRILLQDSRFPRQETIIRRKRAGPIFLGLLQNRAVCRLPGLGPSRDRR